MKRLLPVLALLWSGCALNGLSFVQDTRVRIVEPRPGESVALPFDLRWAVRDHDGRFAVLFDRPAMKPGEETRALVHPDDPCLLDPQCPDEDWLAERGVFIVDGPPLHVDVLPDRRPNKRATDRHEAIIVLLDRDGRREGESTFVVEFVVERN